MVTTTHAGIEQWVLYEDVPKEEKNYNYEQVKEAGVNLLETCFILETQNSNGKNRENMRELVTSHLMSFTEFMKGESLTEEEQAQVENNAINLIAIRDIRQRNIGKSGDNKITANMAPTYIVPGNPNVEIQFYFQDLDKREEFPIMPGINVVIKSLDGADFNTKCKVNDLKDVSQYRANYYRDRQPLEED